MRWYINDASLQGQFNSVADFEPVLRALLELRRTEPARSSLFVARTFGFQPVVAETPLAHAVQALADRDLRLRVLQWVNQRGPFFDDDRLAEVDDLFECLGVDVTDQGLGKAARRTKSDFASGAWSFAGGVRDFCRDPLPVLHGLPDAPIATFDVANVWTVDAFRERAINALPQPGSWADLANVIEIKYPRLLIADSFHINANVRAEPFNTAIGERTRELCRHLNSYVDSRNADGSPSGRTNEILRIFFTGGVGAEPLFTPESASNQSAFRSELTFTDPNDGSRTIFAHWHGKIRHRFFRLHFEWPVPRESARIKLMYLGPKLTKD